MTHDTEAEAVAVITDALLRAFALVEMNPDDVASRVRSRILASGMGKAGELLGQALAAWQQENAEPAQERG